jgi:hypothetical protein
MLRVSGEDVAAQCRTVLVVPERAIAEPGYIKAYAAMDGAGAKHEYHALAQMAYFQFQDDELDCTEVRSPLTVDDGIEVQRVEDGMVLCRDTLGAVSALVFAGQNRKKLLEAAYRYCTRWVRLDI